MSNQWKIAGKKKIFVLKSYQIDLELERQILEKDNVINFLRKQLASNNINHQDSPNNTVKKRHNC